MSTAFCTGGLFAPTALLRLIIRTVRHDVSIAIRLRKESAMMSVQIDEENVWIRSEVQFQAASEDRLT